MSIFSCSFYSVWLDYLSVSGPIPHYVNYSNFTTSSGYQQDQSLKQGWLTASISILSLPFSYRINLWILLVLLRQNYSRLPSQLDMSMWLNSGQWSMRESLLKPSGQYLDKKERCMKIKISPCLLDFVVSANDSQRQFHEAFSPRILCQECRGKDARNMRPIPEHSHFGFLYYMR